MAKQRFLRNALAFSITILGVYGCVAIPQVSMADSGRLFPKGLPTASWSTFKSPCYSKNVTGVIHDKDYRAVCGAPLGSIDTGYLDIETGGTLGYSSIFNDRSPQGGPDLQPGNWTVEE